MARYIDADALIKKIYPMGIGDGKYTINAKAVKLAIDNAPTADVVPKSEVDMWYHEYHFIKDILKQEKMYHRETEKLADKYCAELQTAKSEVTREIFEGIDSAFAQMICETHKQEIDAIQKGDIKRAMITEYGRDIIEIAHRTLSDALKKKYAEGAE